MACCKCCCAKKDPAGECCGPEGEEACCQLPDTCCKGKACCTETETCCGSDAFPVCCEAGKFCCDDNRCKACCSAIDCPEGWNCCGGTCRDAPCVDCDDENPCPEDEYCCDGECATEPCGGCCYGLTAEECALPPEERPPSHAFPSAQGDCERACNSNSWGPEPCCVYCSYDHENSPVCSGAVIDGAAQVLVHDCVECNAHCEGNIFGHPTGGQSLEDFIASTEAYVKAGLGGGAATCTSFYLADGNGLHMTCCLDSAACGVGPAAFGVPVVLSVPAGPGTELKALLARFGIVATKHCSCTKRAKLMDEMEAKEPGWCEANIETICDWLQEEATKRKLPFLRAAGKMLVRRAIRNAAKKANNQ